MSEFRKGIVRQEIVTPKSQAPTAHIPRARIVTPRASEPPQQQQSLIVMPGQSRQPAVRGVLVDTRGKIHRGLSQATLQAHQAHTADATEMCKNCGEMKTPAEMGTVVGNAYNPNNPLRMCLTCKGLSYKDPNDPNVRWQPKIPQIRFNRDRGSPYDAHQAGITMKDLTNRDTYHKEREVDPELRITEAPRVGQWSGGARAGHAHTQASLDQSRVRASRVRR